MRVQFTAIGAKAMAKAGLNLQTQAELTVFTRAHAQSIVEEVRPYPAWTPQFYQRTGRLGTSWRVKMVVGLGAIRADITNAVQRREYPYNYYAAIVQGAQQLDYHEAHGWKKLQDHLRRPEFVAGAQAIISRGIGR